MNRLDMHTHMVKLTIKKLNVSNSGANRRIADKALHMLGQYHGLLPFSVHADLAAIYWHQAFGLLWAMRLADGGKHGCGWSPAEIGAAQQELVDELAKIDPEREVF